MHENNSVGPGFPHLKEKTVHGTPLLPFARYHTNISDMLPFYPIHWHEEVEIIKIQSGIGKLCVDGNWYTAEKGDIFILRPFAMHSVNRFGNNDMIMDAVVFNLRLLETDGGDICTLKYFAPLLNEKNAVPVVVKPQVTWYGEFDKAVCDLFVSEGEDGEELGIKANLYKVFYLIYSNRLLSSAKNVTEDRQCYTVRRALEYIRTNYKNKITVDDIAEHCGYSAFYVMKLFKRFAGVSCVEYANNYRLNVAGQLLLASSDDVAEIARSVGFANISYFNRQFKKQYGATPKAFRSQNGVTIGV